MLRSCRPQQLSCTRKCQSATCKVFLWRICQWLIIMRIVQVCCGAVPRQWSCTRTWQSAVENMWMIDYYAHCPGMLRSCPTAVELYKKVPKHCGEICEWLIIKRIVQVCCGAVPRPLSCTRMKKVPKRYRYMLSSVVNDWLLCPLPRYVAELSQGRWVVQESAKALHVKFFCGEYVNDWLLWLLCPLLRYVAELSHGCGAVQERGRARQMGRAHDGGAHWLQKGILPLFSLFELWWKV
jgi:hypothetical protein